MTTKNISDLDILYFDIETSPCLAWCWSTGKQYIGHEQIIEPPKIICIAYKWGHSKTLHSDSWDVATQNDQAMLTRFSKIADKADILIGHNEREFDVKMVNTRLAFHSLPQFPIASLQDTLLDSRKVFRLPSHSLAYIARYFGLGAKAETGGHQLWLDVWRHRMVGALIKMVKYCKQDVVLLQKVHKKLMPYTEQVASLHMPQGVCVCGGKVVMNGFKVTRTGKFQVYKCQSCGKITKSTTNIIKAASKIPR